MGCRCLGTRGAPPGFQTEESDSGESPSSQSSLAACLTVPETQRRRNRGRRGWGSQSGTAGAFIAPALARLRGGAGCYGESCESVPACGVRHTHNLGKATVSEDGAAELLSRVSDFTCMCTCLVHAQNFVAGILSHCYYRF